MRTLEEIYSALAAEFEGAAGISLAEGGDMALRLRAVAAEMLTLEAQAEFAERQCFPQTAQGEYLDRHAQMRGLSRLAAAKAAGTLRFFVNEAAAADISIPEGTYCMTGAGTAFVTTAKGVIKAGSTFCDAAAEALESGEGGNVPMASIVYIKLAPAGVEGVTNVSPFSGGRGEESDGELRERVLASYAKLSNGGNVAWYEKKALNIPGVAAVKVLPRARGIGTVDIIIAADGGVPSADKLAQVAAAIEPEREICVDLAVKAAEELSVDTAAAISVSPGWDFESVKAAAEKAVESCFSGRSLGKNVYRARIGAALMAVEGLENYALISPAADIEVGDGQLPVCGSISISEAV